MPKIVVLAQYHQFKGAFTNNKNAWEAIQRLLSIDPDVESDNVDDAETERLLVILDENGKIEGVCPNGETERFTTATYAHLCYILRRDGRAGFYDAGDFRGVFGVWLGELNEIYEGPQDGEKQ